MSNWVCKECGETAHANYDHVGPNCEPNSTDCPGTYEHPSGVKARDCSVGRRTLTHAMVETRDAHREALTRGDA